MQKHKRGFSIVLTLLVLTCVVLAQDSPKQARKQAIVPLAGSNPVVGSGTAGQITKWTGVSGSNTYTVGDSNIFEDKFGKIGIGTRTPTSPLTVQGMIETTLGGIKFPDGTLQTTSTAGALFGVTHNATLQGDGTVASPLGVAVPLNLSGSLTSSVFSATNGGNGNGVSGTSAIGIGVNGSGGSAGMNGSSVNGTGVFGDGGTAGMIGSSADGFGVKGATIRGTGVDGFSESGDGVKGATIHGRGVRGESFTDDGVSGEGLTGVNGKGRNETSSSGGTGGRATGGNSDSNNGGPGLQAFGGDSNSFFGGDGIKTFGGVGGGAGNKGGSGIVAFDGIGVNGATSGLAGSFIGNVDVQGKLTKSMGTFKIDHPLDPENKYLYHSFVESPDMMNIYNGNITTDPNGEAVVEMPDYFDALNKDFRYQLTVIGQFAQAIVASEMKDNRFTIKTNAPTVKVSWMVTGVRQDAYAKKNRVIVEENKSEQERGHYLHPEVFNQPDEKSIEWARHPELMQKLKQQRLEAEQRITKRQRR